MPYKFEQTADVYLTPISPVHIGCGEDYQPMRCVIERGILYAFEPSVVRLPPMLRQELLHTAAEGDIFALARFFSGHAKLFIPAARTALPVADRIQKNYQNAVTGKSDRNQNLIQRTLYTCQGNDDVAYIPGSSVKGAVRTALLDRVNDGQPLAYRKGFNFDRALLGGDFSSSPLRFFKLTDFMPDQPVPRHAAQIKRLTKSTDLPLGIPNSCEVIDAGSYRAFKSTWTLLEHKFSNARHCYGSFAELAKDVTRKSNLAMNKELQQLSQMDGGRRWVQSARTLLAALKPALDAGSMALIRIGKNQGAESLVLSGGIARIPIRHHCGAKTEEPTTSTQFYAVESGDLLPFGWCILEFQPAPSPELSAWCSRQPKSQLIDLTPIRRQFQAAEAHRQAEAELKAREAAEEAAREEEERRRSLMSEEDRRIQDAAAMLRKAPGTVRAGTQEFRLVMTLLSDAESWPVDKQKRCAEIMAPLIKAKDMYQGKAAKEIKAHLRRLRNEQ